MNSSPAYRLQLFGSATIARHDGEVLTGRAAQRHRLALLALLAVSPGHGWSREKLMVTLWPDSDTERGRNLLNVAVYVLRQVLGENAIVSDGDELRLNTEVIGIDVADFESALASGDHERATALYQAPFLDGFFLSDSPEFERWVDAERARFAASYANALEAAAESAEQQRDFSRAVEWWKRRAVEDPYDSRVALRLVQALHAKGNPAGALQHAAIHARLLQEEFGLEPPAEFAAATDAIRTRPRSEPATRSFHDEAPQVAVARVPEQAKPQEPPRAPTYTAAVAPARSRRAIQYGSAAALLVVLIFAATRLGSKADDPAPPVSDLPSIAVLPLASLSADPRDAVFADGMTEELIAILSRTGNLRVIASTSAFRFRNHQLDVRRIADSLRVSNVLEGGFQKIGSRLRVQVRLVDARDGSTRWSSTYDRELKDVFSVQNDIAQSVARELNLRLARKQSPQPRLRPTRNVAAYELYLRGNDDALLRSDSGAVRGLGYFKQAVALDSIYAGAYAGLARMYLRTLSGAPGAQSRRAGLRLAEAAALRAVALDDSLAEAHHVLGGVLRFRGDYTGAEREALRAVALDPGYVRARGFLVQIYIWTQRPQEALSQAQLALQTDPLAPAAHAELAHALLVNDRCDEALAQLQQIADVKPPLLRAASIASQCYARKQMWPEAIAQLRSNSERDRSIRGRALLGYMLARAGQTDEARRIQKDFLEQWNRGDGDAYAVALTYLGFRDLDQAFLWLNRAADEEVIGLDFTAPILYELRGDPRFERLRRRLGIQKR